MNVPRDPWSIDMSLNDALRLHQWRMVEEARASAKDVVPSGYPVTRLHYTTRNVKYGPLVGPCPAKNQ